LLQILAVIFRINHSASNVGIFSAFHGQQTSQVRPGVFAGIMRFGKEKGVTIK
jgi:predicted hotdog family 3-hydroxylacyl-ACP dehydratase